MQLHQEIDGSRSLTDGNKKKSSMGGKMCVCAAPAMWGFAAFVGGDELDEPHQPVSAGLDNDGNNPNLHPFK